LVCSPGAGAAGQDTGPPPGYARATEPTQRTSHSCSRPPAVAAGRSPGGQRTGHERAGAGICGRRAARPGAGAVPGRRPPVGRS
ncbi:hypothetical protein ABTD55_22490, partial [Acinetobacter baumannii]